MAKKSLKVETCTYYVYGCTRYHQTSHHYITTTQAAASLRPRLYTRDDTQHGRPNPFQRPDPWSRLTRPGQTGLDEHFVQFGLGTIFMFHALRSHGIYPPKPRCYSTIDPYTLIISIILSSFPSYPFPFSLNSTQLKFIKAKRINRQIKRCKPLLPIPFLPWSSFKKLSKPAKGPFGERCKV